MNSEERNLVIKVKATEFSFDGANLKSCSCLMVFMKDCDGLSLCRLVLLGICFTCCLQSMVIDDFERFVTVGC